MLKIHSQTKTPPSQTIKSMWDALLYTLLSSSTQLSLSLQLNSAIIWQRIPGVSRRTLPCQLRAQVPDPNIQRSIIRSLNTRLYFTLSRVTWSYYWDWYRQTYTVLRHLLVHLSSIHSEFYSRYNKLVDWKQQYLEVEGWCKYLH